MGRNPIETADSKVGQIFWLPVPSGFQLMPVHYKNATVAHQPKTAIGVRSFGPHFSRLTGREYMGYSPSKKSVQRIRQKVAEHLAPNNVAPREEVGDRLNQETERLESVFRTGESV